MPTVYLSPSTQEYVEYVGGGNEEYYMNRVVDAMIPYLRVSGIGFKRNNPGDEVQEIIEQSNEQYYDLHMALHTKSSPDTAPLRGIDVHHYYYSPVGGEIIAYIIAQNLKEIYPEPDLVSVVPSNYRELRYTNAPAVYVELGYHDNPEDVMWLEENINEIAKQLVLSISQFLNRPFVDIQETKEVF